MMTDRIVKVMVNSTAEMNSMNTRSGQTSTSSSRARLGRGLAGAADACRWASTAICLPLTPLQRTRHPAVAADAPEVDRHHDRRQQR